MAQSPKPHVEPVSRTFAFGDFEFDAIAGELHNRGTRIHLTPQCQSLLRILLENAGTVVTRQELRDLLWPNIFVDHERNLNRNVAKLRFRLNDDPDNPRFIETVAGKGYRFIAPITFPLPARRESIAESAASSDLEFQPAELAGVSASPSIRSKGGFFAFAAAVLVAAALIPIALKTVFPRYRSVTPSRTVVVVEGEIENKTGDPVFDDTLRTALEVSLRQSPLLHLLSNKRIANALALMTRPSGTRLTPELSSEICQREGGNAYITGSISTLGKAYTLSLAAVDCHTGEMLAQEQTTASSKEDVLRAVGESASSIRRKLGESAADLKKFDVPVTGITAPSLEALKAYTAGIEALRQSGDQASIPYFEHAAELDPEFALAYSELGARYDDLFRSDQAAKYVTKAFELRGRTSQREQLLLSVHYYVSATDQFEKAAEHAEIWARLYPDDAVPHRTLSAVYMWLGQNENALPEALLALKSEHNDLYELHNLLAIYLALDRINDAEAVARQIKSLAPTASMYYIYRLAFLRGDEAEMQRQLSLAQASSDIAVLTTASDAAAFHGRIAPMFPDSEQVHGEPWARSLALYAIWEAEFGLSESARRDARASLRSSSGRAVRILAALAFARAGDIRSAEKLESQLAREEEPDSLNRQYWLACIDAALALDRRNASQAVTDLLPARKVELSADALIAGASMQPVYLRGVALMQMGRNEEAVREFEKIVHHAGLVATCPIGALAHFQLARAYRIERRRNQSER